MKKYWKGLSEKLALNECTIHYWGRSSTLFSPSLTFYLMPLRSMGFLWEIRWSTSLGISTPKRNFFILYWLNRGLTLFPVTVENCLVCVCTAVMLKKKEEKSEWIRWSNDWCETRPKRHCWANFRSFFRFISFSGVGVGANVMWSTVSKQIFFFLVKQTFKSNQRRMNQWPHRITPLACD